MTEWQPLNDDSRIIPNVGVGIIIERNDQVLLLRRKNVHGDGTWSTPGGYLDFGESPEACAIREAHEETGVHASGVYLYGVTSDVFMEANKHFITLWMKARRCEGESSVNADDEMSEVGWFKWSELPEPLFVPFRKIVAGQYYKTDVIHTPRRKVEHMNKAVKLQDIIDGMEMQFDELSNYVNVKTGEVVTVSRSDYRIAENEEPIDQYPDWQQDAIRIAIDLLDNEENYEPLPTQYDINEYEMIRDFCYEVKDTESRETLLDAIYGKGAFRRFKDKLYDVGLKDEWFAYRDERYKQLAIEWCNDRNLKYTE